MKDGPAVRIREIRLRRLPGLEQGGFAVKELSAGINVIYGPNASGKSTLARGLAALLWPQAYRRLRPSLLGSLALGDDIWTVDVDADRARYQVNGQQAPAPPLPAAEFHSRYILPLHELLQAGTDDAAFAELIERESAGGYDLDQAGRLLGARDKPSRPSGLISALNAANKEVRSAAGVQQEAERAEERLRRLSRQIKEAHRAARRKEQAEKAIALMQADRSLQEAQELLDRFPKALAAMRGDEAQQAAELAERLEDLAREIHQYEIEERSARSDLEQCRLPAGGLPGGLLPELQRRHQDLLDKEREIDRLSRELAEAQDRRESAAAALGPEIDPEGLSVDLSAVAAAGRLLRRSDEWRRRWNENEAAVMRLAKAAERLEEQMRALSLGERLPGLRELTLAIENLRRWLRAPDPSEAGGPLRVLAFAASGLLTAAGALAGLLQHPLWWLLSLAGAALLAGAAWVRPGSSARLRAQSGYLDLGLPEPAAWTSEAVGELLDRLDEAFSRLREQERLNEQRQGLEQERADLVSEQEALEAERRRLSDLCGLKLDLDEAGLLWLMERLRGWHEADSAAKRRSAELEAAQKELSRLLAEAQRALEPYWADPAGLQTAASLHGAIEDLRARHEAYVKAERRLESAVLRLGEKREEQEKERHRLEALYEEAGLEPGDLSALEALCRKMEAYQEAQDRLRTAQHAWEAARREADAAEVDAEWLDRSLDELERERMESAAAADRLRELYEERGRCEQAVESAKRDRSVEAALAKREEIRAQLLDHLERQADALLTHILVKHLQRATQERDRPQVFHRAQQLLAEFTAGLYELRVSRGEDGKAAFLAIDQTSNLGRSLDELSSGTKVQLLFAVRLAFVETQEAGGPRLPLILDETLANSDDLRAKAIMDVLTAIARTGRQLFYFTAQVHDRARWEKLLGAEGVEGRVIDILEARGMAAAEAAAAVDPAPVTSPEPPDPGGLDHRAYGRLLQAPPIDPWQEAGSAHIWHVVEEPRLIHRLLRHGIATVGQLDRRLQVSENAGGIFDSAEPEQIRRIAAAIKALRSLIALWRRGRGRPVTREMLQDSGAVSPAFIDRVWALAQSVDRSGPRLIEALRRREARGFRQDKADELEAYLQEAGAIPSAEPLPAEELPARVLDALGGRAGDLDFQTLRRLIDSLPD